MRDDQHRFLALLGQLPARLTAEQAAWVLNCQVHDVPVLVVARLLKPLGNPQPNSQIFRNGRSYGTRQGPRLVGEGDERRQPTLEAKESA